MFYGWGQGVGHVIYYMAPRKDGYYFLYDKITTTYKVVDLIHDKLQIGTNVIQFF